jgi:hypothetical protein
VLHQKDYPVRAIGLVLAGVLCISLMTTTVSAQHPEGRGYGGPMYVGPNFQQGGQHAPPDYSAKPSKKAAKRQKPAPAQETRKKSPTKAAKAAPAQKAPAVETAKPAEPDKTAEPEKSAEPEIAAEPQPEHDETATVRKPGDFKSNTAKNSADTVAEPNKATASCSRFDATTGTTVTVPCE